VVELRSPEPIIPLRLFRNPVFSVGNAYGFLGGVAFFGGIIFLPIYLQAVKGFSPVRTGVAFLPMIAGVLVSGRGIATHLLPKVAPRALIGPGMLIAAAGLAWMSTVDADTGYVEGVMTAQIILGLGVGLIMPVAMNYATQGVPAHESGVASATANTGMQIGGSIGTALLNTIATSATASYIASHAPSPSLQATAMVEGFSEASAWAAGIIAVGAVAVIAILDTPPPITGDVRQAARAARHHLTTAAPTTKRR
jgi:MFS family permease